MYTSVMTSVGLNCVRMGRASSTEIAVATSAPSAATMSANTSSTTSSSSTIRTRIPRPGLSVL